MSRPSDPANLTEGERAMLEEVAASASGVAYIRGRNQIAARLHHADLGQIKGRGRSRRMTLTDAGRSAIGLAPRGVS